MIQMTAIKQVRKAVIPAAGLGTRFLPATKATPKEMLPIVDKPTIQYIIEEVLASGIEDILIITGRSKRAIEDHFDRSIELELNLAAGGKAQELEMVKKISDIRIHYSYAKVGDARALASVIGEDELSPIDKKYLAFGKAFESRFIGQGPTENRTILETLDIGWELLGMLPREELDRIDTKILDQYYKPADTGADKE